MLSPSEIDNFFFLLSPTVARTYVAIHFITAAAAVAAVAEVVHQQQQQQTFFAIIDGLRYPMYIYILYALLLFKSRQCRAHHRCRNELTTIQRFFFLLNAKNRYNIWDDYLYIYMNILLNPWRLPCNLYDYGLIRANI